MRDVLSSNDDKECVHSYNDKHIPKLYYFDNNKDPGPIPPALMVMFMLTQRSCDRDIRNGIVHRFIQSHQRSIHTGV